MTRKTLRYSTNVSGIGLHTGEKVKVTLHHAEAGAGISFRVKSSQGTVTIPALVPFVVDTRRRVVLQRDGIAIQTVEHLLSACLGMGITDLLVEVDGPELPIGDGSALLWSEAFISAQFINFNETVPVLSVTKPLTVNDGKVTKVKIEPCNHLTVQYTFLTTHPLVGVQEFNFDESTDDFVTQIAPARTFGFYEEVQSLWEQGLAKGGSVNNAVIIFHDRYSVPLRFPNELARHKVLDLIGDLALLGVKLSAKISAQASGHALHHQLCQSLWKLLSQEANE